MITDLEMPGLGGAGLLRALREWQASAAGEQPLPALVVCSGHSADAVDDIDTRGLADAQLVKPVDLDVLLQTLAALGVQPSAHGDTGHDTHADNHADNHADSHAQPPVEGA